MGPLDLREDRGQRARPEPTTVDQPGDAEPVAGPQHTRQNVLLQRLDDRSKVPDARVPGLDAYEPLLQGLQQGLGFLQPLPD
mgnify:CR=1 FL=1